MAIFEKSQKLPDGWSFALSPRLWYAWVVWVCLASRLDEAVYVQPNAYVLVHCYCSVSIRLTFFFFKNLFSLYCPLLRVGWRSCKKLKLEPYHIAVPFCPCSFVYKRFEAFLLVFRKQLKHCSLSKHMKNLNMVLHAGIQAGTGIKAPLCWIKMLALKHACI